MATSKKILPLPGSNANELGEPSPWIQKEIPAPDYPGAFGNRDPRAPDEMSRLSPEPYPGSGVPGEPWKSPPAPAPRRLRRDS
jgi:hypothetical protein